MAELRTDDAVRRLRAVWLGPEGIRLPVDWTYVEWAGFLALLAVAVPTVGLIAFTVTGDAQLSVLAAGPFGGLVAFYSMRATMRLVDADRPVRYWKRTLAAEARQIRWGHGPADHLATVAAGVVAVLLGRASVTTMPGPALMWFAAGCAAGWSITRRAVQLLRPRGRAHRLERARAERAPAATTTPSIHAVRAPVVAPPLAGPWEAQR